MLKPAKQAKHSFLHSIAMAAVLPVEPEQGTYQKEIAIVRAHLETCDPQSWSADPEQACVRHRIFLSVFLKRDLKKTQVKEIFFGACKRLQQSEAKMIANCIHEVKKWLVKKWKNLKTGEKTHPGVLALMHAIFGDAAEGKANDKPVQGIKRGLTSKSPPAKKSAPIKIARDAGVLDISSESGESLQSLGKASSIPSLIAGVPLQNAVVLRKPAGSPMKKPAAGNKKPAASPKACARQTRIAAPVRACARPAVQMAGHGAWKASVNFSWVKATFAAKKAYVVARDNHQSKPQCLVNLNMEKGPEQSRLMQILLDKAQHQQGLSKAELVQIKNNLLKCAIDVD